MSQLAKYKTIMQITGLSMMLFHHQLLGIAIYKLGVVLTAIAAVLTLWSMIQYLRLAWPELPKTVQDSRTGVLQMEITAIQFKALLASFLRSVFL